MKTCAIIIAAYNCEKYIRACIQSVNSQVKLDGWQYDLRIGVDGCRLTEKAVANTPHYSSRKNMGAYVIRNSLIRLAPADAYAYFDADDVMRENYLSETLKQIDAGHDGVITAKYQCDENLYPRSVRLQNGGAMTFSHKVIEALGGYYHHRVACDTDFMFRMIDAGFSIKEISEPLYFRRTHRNQLTKNINTGYKSEYRKRVWSEMCFNRERKIIKINPVTVKMERVK